jgi:hypothetical protein
MSIIVSTPPRQVSATQDRAQQLQVDPDLRALLDPDLRALLDHVAAELATEYIRLMEAAAEPSTEPASATSA